MNYPYVIVDSRDLTFLSIAHFKQLASMQEYSLGKTLC